MEVFSAERRLGEFLIAQKERGGGLNRGARGHGPGRGKKAVPGQNRLLSDATPTLEEMGIDKKLSTGRRKETALILIRAHAGQPAAKLQANCLNLRSLVSIPARPGPLP